MAAFSANQMMIVEDLRAAGTVYGNSPAGWHTKPLNHVPHNTIEGASLLNNIITLPAGHYYVEFSGGFYRGVRGFQALQRVSDSAILVQSTNMYADGSTTSMNSAVGAGVFTLTETTQVYFRHYQTGATSSHGGGVNNTVAAEFFSRMTFLKIG